MKNICRHPFIFVSYYIMKQNKGWCQINSCELTASVTALANIIASQLDDRQLALIASVLVQLGDTLTTIIAQKALCDK